MAGGVRAAQACRRKADLAVHLASTDRRFSGASGLSWSATRSTWPLPPPLTTTAEPSRRRRWPSTACASLSARFQLGRRRTGRGHRAQSRQPGQPSRAAACPPPRSLTSLRPDTADAGTHGQRTPGRSDVRTGHWTPVAWTGKRGHWSLAPDTGRRTLAGDADRVTTARLASRPPGPPRQVIVRWDAQLCSCGRDLRGSAAHAGSAEGHLPARDCLSHYHAALGRSAGTRYGTDGDG